MRPTLLYLTVLPALVLAARQTPTLADLEARAEVLNASKNPFQDSEKRLAFQADLTRLIDSDTLKTGPEFLRAAAIVNSVNAGFLEARMRHELTFTAVALGDEAAAQRLAFTWDQFLLSTGRRQHMGTYKGLPGVDDEGFRPNLTVACVRDLLADPGKARVAVKGQAANRELADMVDADQKARQGDFTKMTPTQMMDLYKEDIKRRRRLKALLARTRLMTADDYAAASLLMQHGSQFDDFALAHELALCALILDVKKGRELVALTWDRMLTSAGYLQRVGTQYKGTVLSKVDSEGFNDTMRKALGRLPLADVPKTFGG